MNSTTPVPRPQGHPQPGPEASDGFARSARRRGRRSIPAGLEYQQVVAATNPAWWRGVIAILLIIAGLFVLAVPVQILGALLNTSLGLVDPSAPPAFTPITHLTNLVGVALLIPWSMLVHRWLLGVRPRSLHSVTSNFRFDVFGRPMFFLLPVYAIYMGVMSLGGAKTTTWALTGIVAAIVVTILFAPLQAAAEEYGFRGVVFRAAAGWGPACVLQSGWWSRRRCSP
ncbi:hypothetical protein [Saccharopolyspora sp. NPDC050642]|uniref:hypothetical protein n=1 Tax=Saccharopolyspora sp. NPDC050642 TaxID=3157099 RepID=UPI0033D24815